MTTNSVTDKLHEIQKSIDNYRQTVTAIWAFISVLTWDRRNNRINPDRRYSVGRRMTPRGADRQVTPDIVVQISPKMGLVAEAKKTLPTDESHWEPQLEQLRSYDTQLDGWWTPDGRMPNHDVVLLIHQFHGPPFKMFLASLETSERRLGFDRSFGVVEFGLVEQVSQRIHLVLRHGSLRDRDVSRRLTNGVPVPSERVVSSYGQRAFYDSPPPVEYLMEKIWMDFAVAGASGRVRAEGERHIGVAVSVSAMAEQLQRAYGSTGREPREVEYPKISWIRDAMNRLAALKLARRVDQDNYLILYRHVRGDLVRRFASFKEKPARVRMPGRRRSGKSSGGNGQGTLFLPL